MSPYGVLKARDVTRLCHFTKLQSLTHIMTSEDGILASNSIRQDIKNATDTARYDGELDFVCCSVQYPNSWFLKKAIQNNSDKIFEDWVVLYIDLKILHYKTAKFCPCNASTLKGHYINEDMEKIESIFDSYMRDRSRTVKMLSCCPTDDQAEILIKNNIPREYIIGIAAGDEDSAKRVYAILKMYNLEYIPLYIAPDVLTPAWSDMIREGCRPNEIRCSWSEED